MPVLLLPAPTGTQIAWTAMTCRGDRYIWGADPAGNIVNPTAEDCEGLIRWACARNGVAIPAGSWMQAKWCLDHGMEISIAEAKATPGAVLFFFSSSSWRKGIRPKEAHVVISLGNAAHQDIEAHSTRTGVGVYDLDNVHWTFAAKIPGVDYAPHNQPAPPPPNKPDWGALRRGLAAKYAASIGGLPVPMSPAAPQDALHTILLQEVLELITPAIPVPMTGAYDQATINAVWAFQQLINKLEPGPDGIHDAYPGALSEKTKFWLGVTLHNISTGAA